jgi:predicted dehydrogenase
MKTTKNVTRRGFVRTTAAAAAATALSQGRVLGASGRVRVGFIGVGNRGDQVLDAFLEQKDVDVVAICDIHQPYVEFAQKKCGGSPKGLREYRRLLEMKDVDAVVIGTPDHWHALQAIEACQAGKDVYVEKPLSLCVAEGRKIVEAVRKYDRVCQVGIQRASSPMVNEAAGLVRDGAIGKVVSARAFHIQNEWPKGIGSPPDGPAPDAAFWDAWLGPAPKVAYNKNRTFYRFRWFFDYSGGQLTNFGVHYTDTIQRALGHDAPLAVVAMGGRLAIEDNREIPDTLEVLWTYPGGTLVSFTQINANAAPAASKPCEIEFRGTKGTLYLYGSGYEIVPDNITPNEFAARSPVDRSLERGWRTGAKPMIEAKQVKGDTPTNLHARNFVDCVKSRQTPSCDIEAGHRRTSATLLGNIAWRTKSYLEWDAKAERFTNNEAANARLRYAYRAPLRFPDAV